MEKNQGNNNLKKQKENAQKFVRYREGARMYGMGLTKFQEVAKKANAVYKVGYMALVNTELLDQYLAKCRIIN